MLLFTSVCDHQPCAALRFTQVGRPQTYSPKDRLPFPDNRKAVSDRALYARINHQFFELDARMPAKRYKRISFPPARHHAAGKPFRIHHLAA